MQFIDDWRFDGRIIEKPHVQSDDRLIPLETFNLFQRDARTGPPAVQRSGQEQLSHPPRWS